MTLLPAQAMALVELAQHQDRGLFGSLAVGSGKTLITLLAAEAVDAQRPLLILPAKMRRQLLDDRRKLGRHWQIRDTLQIVSYTALSREAQADFLDNAKPDLLILDECHRVKNPRAAVTRRVARYLHQHPQTKVIALSGTVMIRSIMDFAHVLVWCLRNQSPLPTSRMVLERWAKALDPSDNNIAVGALSELAGTSDLHGVRQAIRQRLVDTPGVVATSDVLDTIPLEVNPLHEPMPNTLRLALEELEENGETEQGIYLISDELTSRLSTMACGMSYRWDPPPPVAWRKARNAWTHYVDRCLRHNVRLDTPLQVAHAVEATDWGDPQGVRLLASWRAVRDTYHPRTSAVWLSDFVLQLGTRWLTEHSGLIFCLDVALGRELADCAEVPYFGQKGLCRHGRFSGTLVETRAKTQRPAVCSSTSLGEGFNLQAYNRMLVVNPPASGKAWEQLLGRLHREGQQHAVRCEVLVTHPIHNSRLTSARESASYIEDVTGQAQKLLAGWRETHEKTR